MFSPSLLEYHLLSRHPCCGLLSKRFTYFKVRFRMPYGTRVAPNLFLVYSAFKDLLRYVYSRFSLPSSLLFPALGCGIVSAKGSPGCGIST